MIYRPVPPRRPLSQIERRGRILSWGISLFFLGLGLRLWYLQIFQGEKLYQLSEINRIRQIVTRAPRGEILDRNGKPLAQSRKSLALGIMPDWEKDNPNLLEHLAPILKTSPSELRKRIKENQTLPYDPVILEEDISPSLLAQIEEQKVYLGGTVLIPSHIRYYPDGKVAAHLLGYVGQIDAEELKQLRKLGYRMGDLVGKTGIEKEYNHLLKGRDGGQQVEVDALGRIRRRLSLQPPIAGKTLILTIDLRLQKAAWEALKGRRGALVAIDPRNGEVLALVSSPSYDLNAFSPKITKELWQKLNTDPSRPLLNRAVLATYPPGSTFKTVTAASGLKHKVITPRSTAYCPGGMPIGGRFKRCWAVHRRVDFYKAIALSCDVFFYRVGLSLNPTAFAKDARSFGLGVPTGIDLPSEKKGLIPDPAWKQRRWRQPWYGGDKANMAIGQGYVLTSPLQMALECSVVANWGKVWKPHLLLRVTDTQGRLIHRVKPTLIRRATVSPQILEEVRKGMRLAVTAGTARVVDLPNIPTAAKTGSAQNPHGRTHGWLICFAPYDHPRIAIACIVEQGGHGSTSAGPVVRKVLETFFGLPSTPEKRGRMIE